ncbi:hypothetical protein BGZ58_002367, partial [Dissophora ornata]
MKILFQGDSHLRVATEQLLRRLNGTNEIQKSTVATANQIQEQFGSTTFVFQNDPLFKKPLEKTDVLVANLGQWATGTRFLDNLWSTSKYHDKIRGLVGAVQQRARDLQDFEDEDADSTRRYLGGGDDGHYGYIDDGDDDEDELEMEREILRQKKAKEQEDANVYWDDQTEEEQNMETRPKSRPSREEQEKQYKQESSDDRYSVEDRMRAEREGYMVGEHKKDSYDIPQPRYPSDQLHRQSKHNQTPETGRRESKSKSAITSTAVEDEASQRYRYSTQRKVIVDSGDSLVESTDDTADTSSRRVNDKYNKSNKTRPSKSNPPADKTVNRGEQSGSASSDRSEASRTPQRSPHVSVHREAKVIGNNPSNDNDIIKDSSSSGSSNGLDSYRVSRRSIDDHHHHDPESSLRMVWAGMVAYPETQSVDSLFRHDWRTVYRLRYWNQIAEDVMLLHNIPYMDFFTM